MKANHLQHAIKFGLILGVLRLVIDIVSKELNVTAMQYSLTPYLSLLLEIILIVFAIFIFKLKVNGNTLSIKEAVKIGFIMMIITGTFFFVTYNFYKPEFAQEAYLELTKLREPEKLNEAISNVKNANLNPNYTMGFATNMLKFMFIGLIISAISGVILYKKNN
ncbi:MAG: DUF4199 domain-containing protein [Flavobacteriaceae bacterium]